MFRVYDRINTFYYKYNYLSEYRNVNVSVLNLEKYDDEKVTYLVVHNGDKFLLNIYSNENEDYLEQQLEYKYLDVLNVTVKKSNAVKLNNPYEFDYAKYLHSRNIVCALNSYSVNFVGRKNSISPRYMAFKVREFLEEKLEGNMDQYHLNFFKSIIYSDDTMLDSTIKENFRKCSASYMLVASGTHVLYLLMIINMIFKDKNYRLKVVTLILLVLFAFIANENLSIVRAVISQAIFTFCNIFNIKLSKIRRIFLTFAVMLSYNIFYIFNSGFILSFSCVISISLFHNLIYTYIKRIIYLKILKKYVYKQKNVFCKMVNKILSLISINISVLIGTFPVQINLFHEFNLASILLNIPLTLFSMLQYMLGFLALFLSFIPYLSNIVILANYITLDILIKLASFLSKFSAQISIASLGISRNIDVLCSSSNNPF